nr:hypothetical protein [Kibdelosporangium sp. MJ126-NF4]CEL20760.1 hypothetical protein [Kibdelosporangium sp. MJ126-NF4]
MTELPFLVSIDETEETSGSKGIFSDKEPKVRRIPVDVLKENLTRTVGTLREMFDEIADGTGKLPLKTAQITFEVTATGGITLVGTAQVAGKGAITLTFGD